MKIMNAIFALIGKTLKGRRISAALRFRTKTGERLHLLYITELILEKSY